MSLDTFMFLLLCGMNSSIITIVFTWWVPDFMWPDNVLRVWWITYISTFLVIGVLIGDSEIKRRLDNASKRD